MAVQPSQLEHPGFLPHLLWGTPTGPPPALSQWSPVRALLGGGVGQALGLSVSGASSVWLSLEGFSQPWARGFLGKCPGYRIQEGAKIWGSVWGPLGQSASPHWAPGALCEPLEGWSPELFPSWCPLASVSEPPRPSQPRHRGGGGGGERGGDTLKAARSFPDVPAAALASPSGKGRVAPVHWGSCGCHAHRLLAQASGEVTTGAPSQPRAL